MAETTITSWVCDRCETSVATAPGEEPKEWLGVTEAHTPRSEQGRRVHYCATCSDSYRFWATEGETEAPQPEANVVVAHEGQA